MGGILSNGICITQIPVTFISRYISRSFSLITSIPLTFHGPRESLEPAKVGHKDQTIVG